MLYQFCLQLASGVDLWPVPALIGSERHTSATQLHLLITYVPDN